MTPTSKKNIVCPTCGKKNTWLPENASRPFCSERCKLIDLGEWADEARRIAGEPADKVPDENNHNEDNKED